MGGCAYGMCKFYIGHFIYLFILILFYFLTLHNCISFAKYQNESATGIHVFSILNPPPSSLPIPSLWVVPVHQPQASSIVHRTWTGDSFHTWYFTCFNAILPNLPTLSLYRTPEHPWILVPARVLEPNPWILRDDCILKIRIKNFKFY